MDVEANKIVESFDSQFYQRSNAKMVLEKVNAASYELPEGHLLQLSMDGSSVSWKMLEMLDDHLSIKDLIKALTIGSCNQTAVQKLLFGKTRKSHNGNVLARYLCSGRWRYYLSIELGFTR